MKLHRFHTDEQPPLCGQRTADNRMFLPQSRTTKDISRVSCARCLSLMSDEIAKLRLEPPKYSIGWPPNFKAQPADGPMTNAKLTAGLRARLTELSKGRTGTLKGMSSRSEQLADPRLGMVSLGVRT